MDINPGEIEMQALGLPMSERARLAELLLSSLDIDSDVDAAWMTEVAQRQEQIARGEAEWIPAERVMEMARARIRERIISGNSPSDQ
jgi:hypothetical protein